MAVAHFHQLGDLPQDDQNLLPLGFRRMGGEHQSQTGLLQQMADLIGGFAALLQGADRVDDGFAQGAFGFALADDADALQVLGDVDQLEIIGKGFYEDLLRIQRQSLQALRQLEGGG